MPFGEALTSTRGVMKAKAIKKRLMRSRTRNFWGRRAYLTVRLPRDLVGPTPPLPSFPGLIYAGDGVWHREGDKDFIGERIHIDQWHMSKCPNNEDREPWNRALFVRNVDRTSLWSAWTGFRVMPEQVGDETTFVREAVSEDDVRLFSEHKRWQDSLHERGHHLALDAVLNADFNAKAAYVNAKDDGVYVTFSVKWFYADRKLGFASDLAAAFRKLDAIGVPYRVMR